jgi:murein DD-endopeptidase MepM/ murein hydrolase activator NlpD
MPRSTALIAPLLLLFALMTGCSCGDDGDTEPTDGETVGEATPEPTPEPTPPPPTWIDTDVEVVSGTTIAVILQDHGLEYSEVLALVEASTEVHSLEKIRAGDTITIRKDIASGEFMALLYPLDRHGLRQLFVAKMADGGFNATAAEREVERVPVEKAGVITSSLWNTVTGMGLGWDTAVSLTAIFEWEIDFNSQVREGDAFRMVVEEVRDAATGEVIRHDRILAAEYLNNGKSFVGFRYEDGDGKVGYFNADGLSSKKMFLKSPLKFTRVSSGFGKRFHPVLKRNRNHNGIDYAAPTGTPIRAIGRATVTYAGNKGGYGKHVRLKHSGKYSSSYSHLSRINVRNGQVVEQGQIIGKVGSTGMSTGPHLHFEFYVNGSFTNFLTQRFPRTEPISDGERPAFEAMLAEIAPKLAAIDFPEGTKLPEPEAEPEGDEAAE